MEHRGRLEELAQRLAARTSELRNQEKRKPALRLVRKPEAGAQQMCEIERESHCRMIRHMRRRWGSAMQLLIDQACFGLAGIEQLDDEALVQLHKDLERAQDCIRDGVTFEDAGLIRSRYG